MLDTRQTYLVDTHAHLDLLAEPLDIVLKRAAAAQVKLVISVADTVAAAQKAINFALKYKNVKATVGVHPHEAQTFNGEVLKELCGLAQQPEVVAIGEIGLDFFKRYASRWRQEEAFKAQLHLAKKLNLPVIIHCREAYEELAEILSHFLPHPFVIHCFTGSLAEAVVLLSLGGLLSFTGIITFKPAAALREVVKQVPLEKMLLETDAPYLTPHPYRGKLNEPAFVRYTALKVAEIKQVDLATVAEQTTLNASRFFRIQVEDKTSNHGQV